MNTILLDGSFLNMDCLLPVLLGLGGAGILGWLLKGFLGGKGGGNADLQAKYDKLSADLTAERERNQKLSADNKKKKAGGNTEAMAMGVAATTAGTAEIATLTSKLKSAKDELKRAQDASLELQTKVNEANARAKEATTLNSEVETLKTRIEGLNRANESAKEEASKYKADFDAANSERTRLNNQLATSNVGEMQKRIEKLESDLDSSRLTNSTLTADLERLKTGPRTLGANMPTKKADENKSVDTQAKLEALEAELAKTKESNARFAKEIENNKLSTNVAVNEIATKNNKEISELRSKLKLAEAELTVYAQEKLKAAQQSARVIETPAPTPAPMVESKPTVVVEETKEEEAPAPAPFATAEASVAIEEEVTAPVAEAIKEDLTVVEGIGPKIAEILNNAGIVNYTQLAESKPETITEILLAQGEGYKIHNPGTWPEQAALLRDGKMEEFAALCIELDGGVRLTAEQLEAKKIADAEKEAKKEAAKAEKEAKANPDDLTVLEGVGPVLAKILNEGGIYTYAQLAATDASDIKEILVNAGDKMHDPTSWPKQATLLRDGDMDGFNALCDELKAGR
jgi:predicted flap endonuclease-1-like 5' DNA nuclease